MRLAPSRSSWHERTGEAFHRSYNSGGPANDDELNVLCCCYCCCCCCCRVPVDGCSSLPESSNTIEDLGQDSQVSTGHQQQLISFHRNNVLILHSRNYSRLFLHITVLLLLYLNLSTHRIKPAESSLIDSQYFPVTNKTAQFSIAQLCRGSSIPEARRVEGAVLVSTPSDLDLNCTITFRTKTAHQYFIIRFVELKLGCDDHLKLFDQDSYYGQQSIHDYSCRDNMASVRDLRTTGTFLTIRYTTDSNNQPGDGFRIVITAVFDYPNCPSDYFSCRDHYCISRSLVCDGIHHCLDRSDEISCHGQEDPNDLPYALGLLVVLVLAISTCVIIFIATIYCRRESPYSQYQHQIQGQVGIPLQASSSIMFPNPRTQLYQPIQMSPYVIPQHNLRDGHTAHQQPIIVLYRNDLGNL